MVNIYMLFIEVFIVVKMHFVILSLKMEVVCCFELSVADGQTARCHDA